MVGSFFWSFSFHVFMFKVVFLHVLVFFGSTLTFSLAQCRTTRVTTTDDDQLCKTKNQSNIFELRTISLAAAALKTAFGSVGKNIILLFVNKFVVFYHYYIQ